MWAPAYLGSGIAAYFALAREPAVWIAPLILFCALALLAFGRRSNALIVGALMTAAVALGFVAAQYATHGVAAPVLAKPYGPALVIGRVVGVEAFARKPRILLDRLTLTGLNAAQTPARVRIRLRRARSISGVMPGSRGSADTAMRSARSAFRRRRKRVKWGCG